MRRREFIVGLGGAVAWPRKTQAQQRTKPVVGILNSASPALFKDDQEAFLKGLNEVGFVDGRNMAIEIRSADGRSERLKELAGELTVNNVNVIHAAGVAAAVATKNATTAIPTVFVIGSDPVQLGLVSSLARPGGNITGVSLLSEELVPKRLEMLREVVPTATSMAILVNATNPLTESLTRNVLSAAQRLGLKLHILPVNSEQDFESRFVSLGGMGIGGLVIGADGYFISRSKRLAALADHYAMPTIFQFREFANAGGLISYGGDLKDAYRLAGTYTGRILKGERLMDLPVQQTTKVELFINLKAAKSLGIRVPQSLLGRADEVIE